MHIIWLVTVNSPSWISRRRRMTIENISWSISMKILGRVWQEWNAGPLSNCATGPGILGQQKKMIWFWWPWPNFQGHQGHLTIKKPCLHIIFGTNLGHMLLLINPLSTHFFYINFTGGTTSLALLVPVESSHKFMDSRNLIVTFCHTMAHFILQEDSDTAKYLKRMCLLQQKFYKSNKSTLR